MSSGADEVKAETNGHIDLNEKTQADIKQMVQAMYIARTRPEEWQERINVLIRTTVYALGKEGDYNVNKDFTQLIKANS